jgi:hypothetical protein
MRHLFQYLSKTLAILLCSCLLAGSAAADQRDRPVTGGEVKTNQTQAMQSQESDKAQPLSAEEMADLEQRAAEPGQEVAGGALSNQTLTYIVIALAAAVVVLIAK